MRCDHCAELEEERDAARAVAAANLRQTNQILDAARALVRLFKWYTSRGARPRPTQTEVARAVQVVDSYPDPNRPPGTYSNRW